MADGNGKAKRKGPGFVGVRNWQRFQHYSDRVPPWIKLHAELLDSYEFHALADSARAHLMLLWLLASQCQNVLPRDCRWLAQRIGAKDPIDLDGLIEAGWLEEISEDEAHRRKAQSASSLQAKRVQGASKVPAKRKQVGAPDQIRSKTRQDQIHPLNPPEGDGGGGGGDAVDPNAGFVA